MPTAYHPHGAARDLFYDRSPEVLLSGPAGTGKSRACLHKLDLCARKYPGMRALICRKTRVSLTESGLVTYEDKVLPPGSRIPEGVQRGSRRAYTYPNGSSIVVGGLDRPTRIMSTEYDLIYVQEAIELEEDGWESLTTRLRNGVMPFQQLLADTNPAGSSHWLLQRVQAGRTRLLESRHEDNPTLWDPAAGAWTPEGERYIEKLDGLTGARKLRLRYGRWVQAEGVVYEEWDRALHVVPRRRIPQEWPRYWVVDFGYTNPFVWQEWALDGDGRLYLLRELYQTGLLVEDAAREILALTHGHPLPQAILCDHDAEDRATLERHLDLPTTPAHKAVSPGIQAVKSRLRPAGDGRPRLMVLESAPVRRDPALEEAKRPCSSLEEVDGYIWDRTRGTGRDTPLKHDDHGMDCWRYVIAHVDALGTTELIFY
jgi:hypothetical protein